PAVVSLTELWRNNQLRHFFTESIIPSVSKYLFRSRIEFDHSIHLIDRDDAVERSLQDGRFAHLTLQQPGLSRCSLNELSNLAAQRCHRLQQVPVRLSNLMAEKLHHAVSFG